MKKNFFFCLLLVIIIKINAQTNSQITQHGITWTFDTAYSYGQFANGDYWVVGPVKINSITKPHGVNGLDGSQVNPTTNAQGYDNRTAGYSASADVSLSLPFILQPNQSLVSVISWQAGEPGAPASVGGVPRPLLKVAAVLTCLATAPPVGTLRPSAYGATKTLYNLNNFNWSVLSSLPPVSNTPSLSSVEANFAKFRLDQLGYYSPADYLHPSDAMPWYGRDQAAQFGDAALLTMLNYTQAQKQTLVTRLVQAGIDLYGAISTGTKWNANGGIASGRKFPILYAGLLLNDVNMLSIGTTYPAGSNTFGEDCQTFYISQADVNKGIGYTSSMIGAPEWGIRHCANMPSAPDNVAWTATYRQCCTALAWNGHILAARLLCLKDKWNHNAIFDYTDRYMVIENNQPDPYGIVPLEPGNWRSQTVFTENMWDTYRKYGDPIVFQASKDDTICKGSSTVFYLTGIDTSECVISWNGGPYSSDTSYIASPVKTSTITALVKYKNGLGCIAVQEFVVTVKKSIIFQPSKNDTICRGGSSRLHLSGIDTGLYSVSWNGGSYGSDTSYVVSPLTTATITSSVKNKNGSGCTLSHSFVITVDNCTSIEDSEPANLQIVPNPTRGEIIIYGSEILRNTDGVIALYNLLGEKVYELGLYGNETSEIKLSFRALGLQTGVYLINIQTESIRFNKRIVFTDNY